MLAVDVTMKAATISGYPTKFVTEKLCPLDLTVDDEVALFVHKNGFASEVVRVRDAQIGACMGVLQLVHSSGVEVVERAVVEDAIIAETATGSPTIHALNTTASAIESLTLSCWCSSMGEIRETAGNRCSVAVVSAIAGDLRMNPNQASFCRRSTMLSVSVINMAMSVRRRWRECANKRPLNVCVYAAMSAASRIRSGAG